MSNEVKKIDSNLEAHSISIELIWNSDNNSIGEIEDHYDTLREHLPENEAEGPSIYSHRVRSEIRDATLGGDVWHGTVEGPGREWSAILAFIVSMGRTYGQFVATAFKTDDKSDGTRIEGVIIRDQKLTNFVLEHGQYSDETCCVTSELEPLITTAISLEQIPVAEDESMFADVRKTHECQIDESWVKEGF
ncbi:hypothetical protein HOV93_12220 [Planctomycetes bacterium FF15]|uniref:Uncharacterized protein n=2 Tax=Bremerella alba TaxID=980252 RepID=A0A7V9A6K9_9BACT|nr:hypothetical protein [Bremerella alba]